MNKRILTVSLFAAASGILCAPLAPTLANETAPAPVGPYSVEATPVGTLLDDPAAVEILKRLIPTVYSNEMFQTMGRAQTLKAIQQYEPVALSDEILGRIQAEFDKLHPKK
ncbi:MAG TPA: hypothetical protein VL094_00510 [Sphingomonadaceae bacterium]|nr:hypothetical protein [Sphingomonadaceae bacterium]